MVLTPAVGWDDPLHYGAVCARLAEAGGGVYLNQFDNPDNVRAHYETTGPELLAQTEGLDAVVFGAGTGGTISGVGRFLREVRPEVKVVLADPPGSGYAGYVEGGEFLAEGSSIVEGVGMSRLPGCFDVSVVDEAIRVSDQASVDAAWGLLRDEGLFVGGSAGLCVAAAERYGAAHPGQTVVCNLADGGARYASTLFDRAWLGSKGLSAPETGRR